MAGLLRCLKARLVSPIFLLVVLKARLAYQTFMRRCLEIAVQKALESYTRQRIIKAGAEIVEGVLLEPRAGIMLIAFLMMVLFKDMLLDTLTGFMLRTDPGQGCARAFGSGRGAGRHSLAGRPGPPLVKGITLVVRSTRWSVQPPEKTVQMVTGVPLRLRNPRTADGPGMMNPSELRIASKLCLENLRVQRVDCGPYMTNPIRMLVGATPAPLDVEVSLPLLAGSRPLWI
jgi:hypothetical protein